MNEARNTTTKMLGQHLWSSIDVVEHSTVDAVLLVATAILLNAQGVDAAATPEEATASITTLDGTVEVIPMVEDTKRLTLEISCEDG